MVIALEPARCAKAGRVVVVVGIFCYPGMASAERDSPYDDHEIDEYQRHCHMSAASRRKQEREVYLS